MEQLKEFKRQVEITALVYENPNKYSEYELIQKFGISQATIRRDFKSLVKMGVDIRSRKRGVIADINLKSLNTLLSSYISINTPNNIRNLKQIRKTFKSKTISFFVCILKAIHEKKYLKIHYIHSEEDVLDTRVILPIYLNSTHKSYHVIALENGDLKFFRIEGIKSISMTSEKYQGNTPDIYDIYKNSWGVYSGGREIVAKLKFDKKWGKHFEQRILVDEVEISYEPNTIVVKIRVKLSYEFIIWVMGWGKEVIIIGPEKLKQEVLTRANGLIDNHKVNKSIVN